jgi:hypothetical protein
MLAEGVAAAGATGPGHGGADVERGFLPKVVGREKSKHPSDSPQVD